MSNVRYNDNGFISTEVELPKEGQRVEYFLNYGDAPSTATFTDNQFEFDEPYDGFNPTLGPRHGWWRPLREEKLDSGTLAALKEALREQTEMAHKLNDELRDAQLRIIELEHDAMLGEFIREDSSEKLDEIISMLKEWDAPIMDSKEEIKDKDRKHIQNLENIICGQRKALASLNAQVGELRSELDKIYSIRGIGKAFEKHMKKEDLMAEGYVSADERLPEWGVDVEVMDSDGRIIEGDEVWLSAVDGNSWYVVGDKLDGGGWNYRLVPLEGTYWRHIWMEASPENLAEITDETPVVIKDKGGKERQGYKYSEDDMTDWHICGKRCPELEEGDMESGPEQCESISTDGTYFKRLY